MHLKKLSNTLQPKFGGSDKHIDLKNACQRYNPDRRPFCL